MNVKDPVELVLRDGAHFTCTETDELIFIVVRLLSSENEQIIKGCLQFLCLETVPYEQFSWLPLLSS